MQDILNHWNRESHLYSLISKTVELHVGQCIFFDVGANHGTFALYAASLGCSVIAVEPNREMVKRIELSLRLNELKGNVQVLNNAVYNSDGEQSKLTNIFGDGGVAYAVIGEGDVRTIRIDSILQKTWFAPTSQVFILDI